MNLMMNITHFYECDKVQVGDNLIQSLIETYNPQHYHSIHCYKQIDSSKLSCGQLEEIEIEFLREELN